MSVVMFNAPTPGQPAAVIDRLMNETVTLAEDAKSYILNNQGKANPSQPKPALPALAETAEISRVTSRVSHCMAWLLARKAVNAGELSENEARGEKWRLGGNEVCEKEAGSDVPLPQALQHLSERSLALYERLARLDRDLNAQ